MKWIKRAHLNHYYDIESGIIDKEGFDIELLHAFRDYFYIEIGYAFKPLASVNNAATMTHWLVQRNDDSIFYLRYHPDDDEKCTMTPVLVHNDIPAKDNTKRLIRESLVAQFKGEIPYNTILRRVKK